MVGVAPDYAAQTLPNAAVDRVRERSDAQPLRARSRAARSSIRSAPVIKLPPDATEDEHLALLGLLNSSTACFWMKQVDAQQRQQRDQRGAWQTTIALRESSMSSTGPKLRASRCRELADRTLARRTRRLGTTTRRTHTQRDLREREVPTQ